MDGRLYIVDVVDSVEDYVQLMKQIFDFDAMRQLLTGSDGTEPLRIRIDCLNGGGSHCCRERQTFVIALWYAELLFSGV